MKYRYLSLWIFVLLFTSCAITKRQAVSISPAATKFIKKHHATRIPIIPFTENLTAKVRKGITKKFQPLLSQTISDLHLSITSYTIANIPAITITPQSIQHENTIAIYIHGGAYLVGTANDYMAYQMAYKLGVPVISLDYSLSPKAKYPIALNEVLGAYEAIVKSYPNKKIVVIGESAGGNMVLSLMLKAKENNMAMPQAIALFTPWTDLSGSGDSYRGNNRRDRIIAWRGLVNKASRAYVGKQNAKDPLISPVYADYSCGFPPTIITTGTRDLLLSDCVRLYWKMKNEHNRVELRVWEGMWHAFNDEPKLPEGEACINEVVDFLLEYMK